MEVHATALILPLGRRNVQLGDGNSRTPSGEDEKRRAHNRVVGDLLPMAVAEDEHGGLGKLVAGVRLGFCYWYDCGSGVLLTGGGELLGR